MHHFGSFSTPLQKPTRAQARRPLPFPDKETRKHEGIDSKSTKNLSNKPIRDRYQTNDKMRPNLTMVFCYSVGRTDNSQCCFFLSTPSDTALFPGVVVTRACSAGLTTTVARGFPLVSLSVRWIAELLWHRPRQASSRQEQRQATSMSALSHTNFPSRPGCLQRACLQTHNASRFGSRSS